MMINLRLSGICLVGALACAPMTSHHAWAQEPATPSAEADQPVDPVVPPANSATVPDGTAGAGATPPDAAASAEVTAEQIPPAYLLPPARLAQSEIDAFIADPLVFLNANPSGGIDMERQAQRLAGSDNRTVAALIAIAVRPEIRELQLAAIARGLYRAANEAPSSAAEYAAYIQEAVLKSGNVPLITAFQAVDPEETAALGPGGPGAGGAGGVGGGAGSLGGGGSAGFAGPSSGDAVVPQTSPQGGSTSRGSVSYSEDGSGDGSGQSSIVVVQSIPRVTVTCSFDDSPAGDCPDQVIVRIDP